MPRWEYRVLHDITSPDLASIGEEGWEIFSIEFDDDGEIFAAVAKRPIGGGGGGGGGGGQPGQGNGGRRRRRRGGGGGGGGNPQGGGGGGGGGGHRIGPMTGTGGEPAAY